MNIKLTINWTRSAVALALLSAVFSFSAMAQDNSKKPLDAEAASALRQELIDGLPDLIEDENVIEKITEKWVARRDLAGKTREEILETLYFDTESIIKDPELRDSIWKAWTTVEETDEVAQVETPQKPAAPEVKAPEKPIAVESPKKLDTPEPVYSNDTSRCEETPGGYFAPWRERPHLLRYAGGRMSGVIRWYNHQKGFGFIVGEDGDSYFFHRSNISRAVPLKDGGCITFFKCKIGSKETAIAVDEGGSCANVPIIPSIH